MMIVNYVLIFACIGFLVLDITNMKKGYVFKPFRIVAAVIVLIMAVVATVMGIPITQLQAMIEGKM